MGDFRLLNWLRSSADVTSEPVSGRFGLKGMVVPPVLVACPPKLVVELAGLPSSTPDGSGESSARGTLPVTFRRLSPVKSTGFLCVCYFNTSTCPTPYFPGIEFGSMAETGAQ
jgi:hypothetical protein